MQVETISKEGFWTTVWLSGEDATTDDMAPTVRRPALPYTAEVIAVDSDDACPVTLRSEEVTQ